MTKTATQLQREIDEVLQKPRDRAAEVATANYQRAMRRHGAKDLDVTVDTGVYRRLHGAEPKGRGTWTFIIGKTSYEYSDDPALYRPGAVPLTYSRAKSLAIAEAKRRGALIVGVSP